VTIAGPVRREHRGREQVKITNTGRLEGGRAGGSVGCAGRWRSPWRDPGAPEGVPEAKDTSIIESERAAAPGGGPPRPSRTTVSRVRKFWGEFFRRDPESALGRRASRHGHSDRATRDAEKARAAAEHPPSPPAETLASASWTEFSRLTIKPGPPAVRASSCSREAPASGQRPLSEVELDEDRGADRRIQRLTGRRKRSVTAVLERTCVT